MKKALYVSMVFIVLSLNAWSQNNVNVNTQGQTERPSVALVLSGAGPRGFAHIPLIELMEELGIPIDLVVGTSSGAIVGGLYGAGYSGKEIAQTVLDIEWTDLLQDSTTHLLSNALGSHSTTTNLVNVGLTGDLALNFGGGLLTGQYVYAKFKSLTVKIPSYIDFDDLPVPYRATAVDLLTGELVLMDEGDLAEAMRSSMSLPGAFEPFPVDGRYYLDGFIRNTLPVSAVREMGYDIIIAVEISDKMPEDASSLSTNPISVINQVLALQQAVVTAEEHNYADLVLFPDLTEFSATDYAFSKEVYEKGKIEAEKFRDELLDIRSKIFPNTTNNEISHEDESQIKQVAFFSEDGSLKYRNREFYSDLPYFEVNDIVLNNVYSYDEPVIRVEFEKIKDKPITPNVIEDFLRLAYEKSNYTLLTSRIHIENDESTLELDFYQKDFEKIQIGLMQTFEGTISQSASWEVTTSATMQYRDFLGLGGVLSLQAALLSKSGLEVVHMQPLSDKMFLRSTINAFQLFDIEHSGFGQTQVRDSYFREGNLEIAFGVFFSKKHKMMNEIGLHWIDSTQSSTILGDGVFNEDDLNISYAFDIFTRYTFSNIDSVLFPTQGFYSDVKLLGALPLEKGAVLFEVLSIDSLAAFEINENYSIVLNGFVGTNISQGLNAKPDLITKYGFTTYDRTYFPHVMQRYLYGIHKLALKVDFQYTPENALTVLGGQLFLGAGGAIGNVWGNYDDILHGNDIEWQTSAFTGVQITEAIGMMLRAGAGHYDKQVEPFISFDFIVKYY